MDARRARRARRHVRRQPARRALPPPSVLDEVATPTFLARARRARRAAARRGSTRSPTVSTTSATCAASARCSRSSSSPTARRKEPAAELATADRAGARERGLLLLSCGMYGNVIRLLVPLVIDDDDLERGPRDPGGVACRCPQRRRLTPRPGRAGAGVYSRGCEALRRRRRRRRRRPRGRRRRVLHDARAVRVGQDDDAAADRAASSGPTPGAIELGGDDVAGRAALRARRQHGLPGLRALPAHDGRRRTSSTGCA